MKDLDRHIRRQLQDHEATRPGDAWERFAARFPEETGPSAKTQDQPIRTQLDNYTPSASAEARQRNWETLRQSLDRMERRRIELTLAKALEVTCLALLLFAWWSPFSDMLQSPARPPATGTPAPMAARPTNLHPEPEADLRMDAPQADPPVPTTAPTYASAPAGPPAANRVDGDRAAAAPSVRDNGYPALTEAGGLSANLNEPALSDYLLEPTLRDAPPANPDLLSAATHLNALPAAPLPALPLPGAYHNRRPWSHHISMAMSADIHYIMTPYDHLLTNRGYDQYASGFGASLGYSAEGVNWGFHSRLSYLHLYYLPKPYTEVFDGDVQRGYFSESIRNIELNLLQIGVQARRQIWRHHAWRGYALLGGSAFLAFQANYDRKQTYEPGLNPLPDGQIPTPERPSTISAKRFADGVFEGGTLGENSYLTLDLGMGLERLLNGRVKIFAEPVYHHNPFSKSLGPNNDRIHSLRLFTGVRVLL